MPKSIFVDGDKPYGLGQREAEKKVWLDQRDSRHSMRQHLGFGAYNPARKTWKHGVILNQGQHSSCVGMSGAEFLNCEPVSARPKNQFREDFAENLYDKSKKVDEWEGEDYDGTSTRALAKVLNSLNWIDGEYVWADTDAEIRAWVMNYGPVIFSSTWTEGMFYPDAQGNVWPRGKDAGGHAYLIIGWDQYNKAICQQSWGENWGNEGTFYLTAEARAQLYSFGYWSALTTAQLSYKEQKRRSGSYL